MIRFILPAAIAALLVQAQEPPPAVQEPAPTEEPMPTPEGAPPEPEPGTHTAAKGTLRLEIDADGFFEAVDPQEVRIRFEAYSGELLVASAAANGAAVRKGDEVLRLDAPPMRRQVEAAENELRAARANLARAEANLRAGAEAEALVLEMARHAAEQARTARKWWEDTDSRNALTMNDLSLQRMTDRLRDEEEELDQLLKMYSSEELTNATAEIVVKRQQRFVKWLQEYLGPVKDGSRKFLEVQHPAWERQMGFLAAQTGLAVSQAELTSAQGAVLREAEVVRTRLAVEQQQEQLGKLRRDRELLSVKAEEDGVVYFGQMQNGAWQGHDPRALRVGEKVNAGQVWMTVFAPGRMRVKTDLPENRRFWIPPGRKALVTPVSTPEAPVEGACGAVSLVPGPKGGYELTIDLGTVDARYVPGMKAAIRVELEEAKDVLLVPVAAIARGRVWIHAKGGEDEPRAVVCGRTDGKMTEIVKGLKEGEVVLAQAKK